MKKDTFGCMPDGTPIDRYTLRSEKLSCEILTYGGILRSLHVPNRYGSPVDIVLGFDSLEAYRQQNQYHGALIGRYANRIAGASFLLNGTEYPLCANDGKNHLHGGRMGFDQQVWSVSHADDQSLVLQLQSPDGQEGYPGTLDVEVTYALQDAALCIDYRASCDRDTLCNLTNHAYFNLNGHDSGTVLDQQMQLFSNYFTPTDAQSIPDGTICAVEGTPMDFRTPHPIGLHIDDADSQLVHAGGYDHNWVVDGKGLRPAAKAYAPQTGICLELLTTQPGVQFYTGNYLGDAPIGKAGAEYVRRSGFCLETQRYPDSPHHAAFPSAVLRKGTEYRETTVYRFSTDAE